MARLILRYRRLMVIIGIGASPEHIILIIEIIGGVVVFVAVNRGLGMDGRLVALAGSRNLLPRILFAIRLLIILLILTTSDIVCALLGAGDVVLRSRLNNITVSFLIVLEIRLPFLRILQIFSVVNGAFIGAR